MTLKKESGYILLFDFTQKDDSAKDNLLSSFNEFLLYGNIIFSNKYIVCPW